MRTVREREGSETGKCAFCLGGHYPEGFTRFHFTMEDSKNSKPTIVNHRAGKRGGRTGKTNEKVTKLRCRDVDR